MESLRYSSDNIYRRRAKKRQWTCLSLLRLKRKSWIMDDFGLQKLDDFARLDLTEIVEDGHVKINGNPQTRIIPNNRFSWLNCNRL